MTSSAPSLLIVGASGRLGVAFIRAASAAPHCLTVHAFLRTPSKLSVSDTALCTSIITGDARSSASVLQALQQTHAEVVILTVGVPNSAASTDLRVASARALIDALRTPGAALDYVRIVVVSAVGAGDTRLDYGWGVGTFLAWVIRNVLADHTAREKMFEEWAQIDEGRNEGRICIVRPTTLTEGKSRGGIVVYGEGRAPCWWCDRKDLAEWIVGEVSSGKAFGLSINVTGKP